MFIRNRTCKLGDRNNSQKVIPIFYALIIYYRDKHDINQYRNFHMDCCIYYVFDRNINSRNLISRNIEDFIDFIDNKNISI